MKTTTTNRQNNDKMIIKNKKKTTTTNKNNSGINNICIKSNGHIVNDTFWKLSIRRFQTVLIL